VTPAVTAPPPVRRAGLGRPLADIFDPAGRAVPRALIDQPGLVPLDVIPVPFLVGDGGGRVLTVNQQWLELSGLNAAASRGGGWLSVFGPSDRVALRAAVAEATHGRETAGEASVAGRVVRWSVATERRAGEQLIGIAVQPVAGARPAGRQTPGRGNSEPGPAMAESAGRPLVAARSVTVAPEARVWLAELPGLLDTVEAFLDEIDRSGFLA
jgi:PAS domain-containing protein